MHQTEAVNQHVPKEAFEDFLEVPFIPAVRRGVPPGSLLPAEYIATAPTPAIVGAQEHPEHSPMAVVLEKDVYGIVRAIHVHCSCGSSAVIKLTYEDESETDAAPVPTDTMTGATS